MKELQKTVCQSLKDNGFKESGYINEVVRMATGNNESDDGREYFNTLIIDEYTKAKTRFFKNSGYN